jgi:hypothetical protein
LTSKQIHEARAVRDAEKGRPKTTLYMPRYELRLEVGTGVGSRSRFMVNSIFAD